MVITRFATGQDLLAIRRLRKAIFIDEWQIQSLDYQDVFNDHYSKNIALVNDQEVIGAVRLAYAREHGTFYISDMLLKREHRNASNENLLFSAIWHLLSVNNIQVVRADAYDQLGLFLKLGFVICGKKFTQYGFSCEWTPVQWVVAELPAKIRVLLKRLNQSLPATEALWQFKPVLQCHHNIDGFQAGLSQLVASGEYKNVLLHLSSGQQPVIDRQLQQQFGFDRQDLITLPALNSQQLEQHTQAFNAINDKLNDKHVVAIHQNADLLKPIAQYYALATGKKLIETHDLAALALPKNTHSVTLFLLASDCSHDFYQQLKLIQAQYRVGIISGETAEVVAWHGLKNIFQSIGPQQGDDILLLPFENSGYDAASVNVITRDTFDPVAIKQLTTGPVYNSLSMLSHGRGDMVYQQGHIFCGKNLQVTPASVNRLVTPLNPASNAPYCEKSGYCYKDGVITHAQDLTARFVFLNTCFAYANIFAPQYTVGWAMLKSYASQVIASERAKDGTPIENILAYCLLKAGFNAGDIVYHLNQIIQQTALETQSYILYGDPAVCHNQAAINDEQVIIAADNDGKKLMLSHERQTHLLLFKLHTSDLLSDPQSALFFYSQKKTSIKLLHYRVADTIYLFVFSLQWLPAEIVVYASDMTQISDNLHKMTRALHYAQHNEVFKLTFEPEKRLCKDLGSQIKHIARLRQEGREDLHSQLKLVQKLAKCSLDIDDTHREFSQFMLDKISDRSWIITDNYLDQCVEIETKIHSRCYLCGNQLLTRAVQHSVVSQMRRTHMNCVNCGAIGDVVGDYQLPEFAGPDTLVIDEMAEHSLTIFNPFDYKINGSVGLRLYQVPITDVEIFPALAELTIAPKSSKTIHFTIKVNENVPEHLVFVKSITCLDGAILYSQKNFWVNRRLAVDSPEASIV